MRQIPAEEPPAATALRQIKPTNPRDMRKCLIWLTEIQDSRGTPRTGQGAPLRPYPVQRRRDRYGLDTDQFDGGSVKLRYWSMRHTKLPSGELIPVLGQG